MIAANRDIVERSRTQVGNLAHALKTPLSVIVNEADAAPSPLADKVGEQATLMRDQISFYLERARAAARAGAIGATTEVAPVVDGAAAHFRQDLRRARRGVFRRRAAGAALSRRAAGFRGDRRQSARQCRQMGGERGAAVAVALESARGGPQRAGLHHRRRRAGPRARSFARRRRGAASGSTRPSRAPASACRSSPISPPITAARSRSTTARSAACGRRRGFPGL